MLPDSDCRYEQWKHNSNLSNTEENFLVMKYWKDQKFPFLNEFLISRAYTSFLTLELQYDKEMTNFQVLKS